MIGHDRLFEFSSNICCCYEHLTIIVKNIDRDIAMPLTKSAASVIILHSWPKLLTVRIVSLDKNAEIAKQHETLTFVFSTTAQALEIIERQQQKQRLEREQNLQANFDFRLMAIGLADAQEHELAAVIKDAVKPALALYDVGQSTKACMNTVRRQLQHLVN